MDAPTIQLVQRSWAQVWPTADSAGQAFYTHLFEADPTLQALFKGDMAQQAAKLMQMINAAVGQLDQLDQLVPTLQQLGRRHTGYGVERAHYDTVEAALLKTLAQGLGPAFTPEVKAAWIAVYGLLVTVMTASP